MKVTRLSRGVRPAGRHEGWRMLALLLAAVLVPTFCIVWFMNEAVEIQTTAARQSVLEAYRGQLRFISNQINAYWEARAAALDEIGTRGAAEDFRRGVEEGLADSLLFLDAYGAVTYPRPGTGATDAAEQLAADFLDAEAPRPDLAGLRASRVPGTWVLASPGGRVIALYRDDTVHMVQHALVDEHQSDTVRFAIFPPGEGAYDEAVSVGAALPGWQASFMLLDVGVLDRTARARIASYWWVGVLGIGFVALVALGAGHAFRRQVQLTRLKTDLVAAVSHELRTPLASMRLLVDALLRDETLEPQKTREYLDLIAVENGRLSRLIDNFLTFSRLERNRHQFSFETVHAGDIVQAVATTMRERLHPGCDVDVSVAPNLPPLRADADALITALLNLLDNAYKYTPGEKRIAISAAAEPRAVVFSIADNGIGIPAGEQKRIFRRFYQVDRRLARDTAGVGLGLSIVHEIVRAHGGTVRVRSRSGEGSTFSVRVPATAPV